MYTVKGLAKSKKEQNSSNPGSVAEGADLSATTTSGSTNGTILLDERVPLTLEQAISLRSLFQAKKEHLDGLQGIDASIELAYQMLGVQGRQIVSGELGEVDPHLMLKSEPNGIIE